MSTNTAHIEKKKSLTPKLRFKEFRDEWSSKLLGELIEFKNGKGHEQNIDENGKYIVVNSKFVSTAGRVKKFCNTQISPLFKGEIVMVMSDVPNGKALAKCYLIDIDNTYTLNQRICSLKQKNAANEFLIYLINRNVYYLSFDSGVGQTNLKREDVLNCPLIVPATIPEQQKIASFLSAVDEKIQQLTRKKELLEQYKKGVMQQLFQSESGLAGFEDEQDAQDKEILKIQKSGKSRFRQDNGKPYPKWEEKRLNDLAEIVGGGTPETSVAEYWDGPIQWFTPTEINQRFVSNSKRTITEEGLKNSSAKLLPIGTLLFTSRATIGEISFATVECTTNQGFQSLIVNKANSSEYIYYWIKQNTKEFLRRSQGSTFPEISKNEIIKIRAKVPCLEEQQKIASFLTALDAKIEGVAAQIAHTQTFKKGLLQQMFV